MRTLVYLMGHSVRYDSTIDETTSENPCSQFVEQHMLVM